MEKDKIDEFDIVAEDMLKSSLKDDFCKRYAAMKNLLSQDIEAYKRCLKSGVDPCNSFRVLSFADGKVDLVVCGEQGKRHAEAVLSKMSKEKTWQMDGVVTERKTVDDVKAEIEALMHEMEIKGGSSD